MTREFFEMIRSRTIYDYYREAEAKIQSDVAARPDEDILGIDAAEYTDPTRPCAQAVSRVPEGQAQRSLDTAEYLATVGKAVEQRSKTPGA
jgi:hypothetical protein